MRFAVFFFLAGLRFVVRFFAAFFLAAGLRFLAGLRFFLAGMHTTSSQNEITICKNKPIFPLGKIIFHNLLNEGMILTQLEQNIFIHAIVLCTHQKLKVKN